MNSEEAKDILQLCRPDHVEDLNDPLITEALEQLERDSTLCAWFEDQQIFDAEISGALSRITPSPDLKESILKGIQSRFQTSADIVENADPFNQANESGSNSSDDHSKIVWFRPLIGIAAVLIFAGILLFPLFKKTESSLANTNLPSDELGAATTVNAAGIPDMIQFLGKQIANFKSSKFDKRSNQINELRSHLARSGAPTPAKIPNQLKAVPTIGCVTFDYDGTKMSMICFKNGKVYHLITVDKIGSKNNLLPNSPYSEAQFFEHEKQAFKVWSEDGQIYILSTEGTKEDIPEFI